MGNKLKINLMQTFFQLLFKKIDSGNMVSGDGRDSFTLQIK
jgi:hypothetical protein